MAQTAEFYVGVVANVVMTLGLLLTAWRIYFRLKIGRFWWEDACAASLLVVGLLLTITSWICLLAGGLTSIAFAWINSISSMSVVMLARMSILFSIIRIIHGSRRLLRFTYACAAFFAASWLTQVIGRVWQCVSHPIWTKVTDSAPKRDCGLSKPFSIFEFTTDCISVTILVMFPLCMLWKVKLPRRQRRMILSIFTSSVILAFGALCRTVGQIMGVFVVSFVGFHAETASSIVVCNLLVGVTYTYRFLLHGEGETTETTEDTSDDDDFTTQLRHPASTTEATTLPLTTVDLEVPLTDQQSSIMSDEKSI